MTERKGILLAAGSVLRASHTDPSLVGAFTEDAHPARFAPLTVLAHSEVVS